MMRLVVTLTLTVAIAAAQVPQTLPSPLSLSQALEIALANSTALRHAQANFDRATGQYEQSRSVHPPLTMLSGATSHIENMPEIFQRHSYLDPLRYMVSIVCGVTLKDAPWSALWPNLAMLATFAVVLFAISAWRFRKI